MSSVTTIGVLEVCEQALDLPREARDAWLEATHGDSPELIEAVRRLLARDTASGRLLPTDFVPAGPVADPLPPPERVGVYRLVAPIGEGGMGSVYLAERDDGLFEHTVAVKLVSGRQFDRRAADRFAVERQALARLKHPNIARLLDGGVTADGVPYLLMDYVEGVTVLDHVRTADPSPREVVRLLLQVCEAVADAHRKLVVHGDLKPSNVLITPAGEARLLDFGVARLTDIAGDMESQRAPLTAAYASPERRAGEPPTTADDVYALGLLLRELVGRSGPSTPDDTTARPLPKDLAAIAAKASAENPHDRYGSAGALAADLRRWLRREPVLAREGGLGYVMGRFLARRPRFSAAAAAAILGLAVTATVSTVLYFRAEAERREADRRFAQARGMAHYMLFDLFDGLNRTPGTIPLRRELVDTSRRYLRDLAASPRASTELKAEAAMGYLRLAGVLGLYGAGNLGEREEAKKMLAEAQRLLAAPPPGAGRSGAWQHARGRLRFYQGFEALVQGGGTKAAAPYLADAVAILRRAAALDPRAPDVVTDLWEARLVQADLRASESDYRTSEAMLREELAAWPGREGVLKDNQTTPLLLAKTEKLLGNALFYQDKVPQSAEAYRRANAILEEENRRRPNRSRTIFELLDGWWSLATTLDTLKRPAEALPLLDRAVQVGRARMLVDPDHDTLRRMVILAEQERAGLLARMGRGKEALEDSLRSVEARRADALAKPGDVLAVRGYLSALRPFADVKQAIGMQREACADYRFAQGEWAKFDRRFGMTAQYRDIELKDIAGKIAKCAKAGL